MSENLESVQNDEYVVNDDHILYDRIVIENNTVEAVAKRINIDNLRRYYFVQPGNSRMFLQSINLVPDSVGQLESIELVYNGAMTTMKGSLGMYNFLANCDSANMFAKQQLAREAKTNVITLR